MTKAKAMELMLEASRAVIDPTLARKIAKAFGYKLSDLGIKPKKTKLFFTSGDKNSLDKTISSTNGC